MQKLVALYTCFNRKGKTLNALHSLFEAAKSQGETLMLDVVVTDDGSTDGTSEAIKEKFPEVKVLKGNGNLFWAEGMRNSWRKALENDTYDGYLLLNDDTEIYRGVFEEFTEMHNYSQKEFGVSGIYLGATEDRETGKLTYSGSLITNKLLYKQKRLPPNGEFQKCDIGNANIMMVTKSVVNQIGILTEGYVHGKADYDYTLTASRANIPVLISRKYCGHCENDHTDAYIGFSKKTKKERRQVLENPTKLDHLSHLKFMQKFFPWRVPFINLMAWFKVNFPNTYINFIKNN